MDGMTPETPTHLKGAKLTAWTVKDIERVEKLRSLPGNLATKLAVTGASFVWGLIELIIN